MFLPGRCPYLLPRKKIAYNTIHRFPYRHERPPNSLLKSSSRKIAFCWGISSENNPSFFMSSHFTTKSFFLRKLVRSLEVKRTIFANVQNIVFIHLDVNFEELSLPSF